MPSEQLYDLAFRFRATKLWDALCDTQLFAVRLKDGQIAWCCVMGQRGEHVALAAYVGTQGINSWLRLAFHDEMNDDDYMLIQDCVQCSYENKDILSDEELAAVRAYAAPRKIQFRGKNSYPQFTSYKPYLFPWPCDQAEEEVLIQTLEAGIYVADHLMEMYTSLHSVLFDRPDCPLLTKTGDGFEVTSIELPELQMEEYAAPEFTNELDLAAIRKIKKVGVFECKLMCLRDPVQHEPGGRPYYPFVLLMANHKTGEMIPVMPVMDYAGHPDQMLQNLSDSMRDMNIHPTTIQVEEDDERTRLLLRDFCDKCGTRLVVKPFLDQVYEVQERLLNMSDGFAGDEQDAMEEQLAEILDMLEEMTPEEIDEIPDVMKGQIRQIVSVPGLVPDDLRERARELLK